MSGKTKVAQMAEGIDRRLEALRLFRHHPDAALERFVQLEDEVQRLRDELGQVKVAFVTTAVPGDYFQALGSLLPYVDTSRKVTSPGVCSTCQIMKFSSSGWVPNTCDKCGGPVYHCSSMSFSVTTGDPFS